jgi:hypothetical protein
VNHPKKSFLSLMTALVASFVASVSVMASTVSDYENRLDKAHNGVESMISILQSGKRGTDIRDLIDRTSVDVRKTIPSIETVELKASSVETQNGWLQTDLDKFDQESDPAEQIKILSGISERLSAIESRVRELEAATASGRTKDEDKQKLNEILSRQEYQKPDDKDRSAFQVWLEWFIDWLRSLFPDRPSLPNVDPSGFQPLSVIIQVLVYALVIGLVGFLIYKFAPVIVERFSRREKKERSSRVILGEHIEASRSASDLFAEAESFARQGDLRGAIRKGYIALLCDLADKKIIGLARHKTNRDYLRDVRKRTPLFDRMKRATGSFERHWYGFRTPEPKDWEEFREQYRSALNEI